MKLGRNALFVAAVAVAAVTPLAIRGGLRYHALNKFLRLPHAQTRLAVKPTRRELTNSPPVHPVDLGYATFDSGSTNRLFIESTGSGAAIILTNNYVNMAFLPPYAPEKAPSKISASEARSHPKTAELIKECETDPMAAEMTCEETQALPPSRIFLMNSDDFLAYSMRVALKAGSGFGYRGVEFFHGPYVKGIVRIGQNTNDSRFAAIYLASLDGTRNVRLRFFLQGPSSTNLSHALDPVLRSFRFTVERVDDREAVKALIHRAGIPQRKEFPAE